MALHVLNLKENAFYKKSSEKLRIKNSLGEGVQSNYTIGSNRITFFLKAHFLTIMNGTITSLVYINNLYCYLSILLNIISFNTLE